MKKGLLLFAVSVLALNGFNAAAQEAQQEQQKNIRTGWTFGALPSISFDADLGFQYGALSNIYYFGDGSTYPEYIHSFYVEASNTTKNYALFRLAYDSKYLIPNHRLSVDLSYMPDALCDFYGYNGYQSVFHSEWIDEKDTAYFSPAFYKMKRDIFRFSADLQGHITGCWYWNVGLGILNYGVGGVNLDKIYDDTTITDTSLYSLYVENGLVKANEKNGGLNPYIHGGVTYDTRDRQQNPHSGIHADAFLTYNASFGDQKEYNNIKFNAAWRHYIPVFGQRATFAYRAGTQLLLAGESPFYANNYMNQLYMQRAIYEGPGGANSVRGIMRNRILADGFAYANAELRIQLVRFKIKKENFYIGINPFVDGGMVLQPMEGIKELSFATDDNSRFRQSVDPLQSIYAPHFSGGCGLKIAMNDNFVVSVDWAMPFKDQDNYKNSNIYVKIGYMF